jgi:hypothetical protein
MPNMILLRGDLGDIYDEGRCAATDVLPGMLINFDSSGEIIPHGTAVGNSIKAVAIEDALQGKTIDDAYEEDDLVRYHVCQRGEIIYFRLADAQTIAVNDALVSNGDGYLKEVVAATTDDIVAFAVEAVTTSGATGWVKGRVA